MLVQKKASSKRTYILLAIFSILVIVTFLVLNGTLIIPGINDSEPVTTDLSASVEFSNSELLNTTSSVSDNTNNTKTDAVVNKNVDAPLLEDVRYKQLEFVEGVKVIEGEAGKTDPFDPNFELPRL